MIRIGVFAFLLQAYPAPFLAGNLTPLTVSRFQIDHSNITPQHQTIIPSSAAMSLFSGTPSAWIIGFTVNPMNYKRDAQAAALHFPSTVQRKKRRKSWPNSEPCCQRCRFKIPASVGALIQLPQGHHLIIQHICIALRSCHGRGPLLFDFECCIVFVDF